MKPVFQIAGYGRWSLRATARIRPSLAALFVVCFSALASPAQPVRPALRLVSTAPAVTETLFDLGFGSNLVGRSSGCLHPAAALALPVVGPYAEPSLEKILALRPTHLLETYLADPAMSNRLERAGVRVLHFPCDRLADIPEMRAQLVSLVGGALAEPWTKRSSSLSVLAIVDAGAAVTSGPGTLVDDVIHALGCVNAGAADPRDYYVISPEAALKADPDVVLMLYDCGTNAPAAARARSTLRRLRAVAAGRVYTIPDVDEATRPGPRTAAAVERLRAVLNPLPAPPPDLSDPSDPLFMLRLLRVLAGLVVGAALALAGCALQTVLRNDLADPFVLGLSGGASLGAALALASGLAALSAFILPAAAFAGALVALALVGAVARAAGRSPVTLILAGVVFGAIASSLLMLVLTFSGVHSLQSITWWMLGNLQNAEPPLLAAAAACVAVAAAVLLSQARALNALVLGPDLAKSLGVETGRVVPLVLAAASLATAAAVSLAGVIGFVGLIVPHAVRRLVGTNHRALLPVSALAGGLFLVACDALGRGFGVVEIPAGVVTALTGGPFFLYLLIRRKA